jgi:hypothetical protein
MGVLARCYHQINVPADRHQSGETLFGALALPEIEIPCLGVFERRRSVGDQALPP